MSYVVLARKWRPARFEDLVGQDHVAKTLANAIASGRIAHAFLFTGVRGVGKTTSARLLARALNCMGRPGTVEPGVDPGPTSTPCLECPACLEITAGGDVDVREIDGASYTGVDEVRKLQEGLPYRPARDRYKIYIIDEVHMLSSSAWNAFLKTLEEPPPHVKFIFATTEVHKVPVTILSRVQRFDFKLIPARLITDRLSFVLKAEGVNAEEGALSIIAREAAGSMRDAMSLLDQVIAWNDQELDAESVARVLGVASRTALQELARHLVDGEAAACLELVARLANQGFDMQHVARDLLLLLRDLTVAKVCSGATDLLDLPNEEKRDVLELAERCSVDDLVRLHHGFAASFDEVARSGQPRAALEMLLVRLARRPPLLPLDELLARLGQLERRLAGAAAGSPAARLPNAGAQPPRELASRPQNREAATPAKRATETRSSGGEDPDGPAPTSGALVASAAVTTPHQPSERPAARVASSPTAAEAPLAESAVFVEQDVVPEETDSEGELLAYLQQILEAVQKKRPDIAATLEHAVPLSRDGDLLTLGWPPDNVLGESLADELVSTLCCEAAIALELPLRRLQIEHACQAAKGKPTLAARESAERARRVRAAQDRVRQHPRVRDAIELLGARLREVRLPELA